MKITKGKFNLQINSKFYNCKEGDIIFINSGDLHYFKAINDIFSTWTSIVFDINQLNSSIMDSCSINFINPIINKEFKLPIIIDDKNIIYEDLNFMILRILDSYKRKFYDFELEIKGMLMTLFSALFRENLIHKNINYNESKISKIKNVISYIENNYSSDISISFLASLCHYNEQHFIRFFKKYTGKTCIQFVKDYRLEKAFELIKN